MKKFFAPSVHTSTPLVLTINLDLAPEKRWLPVIQSMSEHNIIAYEQLYFTILNKIKPKIQLYIPALVKSPILPDEYKRELYGIVNGIKERLGHESTVFNYENLLILTIAYEALISCTAGVIVGNNNHPYLFRNFDLPIVTIRKTIVTIHWIKNNKIIFTTVGFPFVLSAYTGQRHGEFAIAINARHNFIETTAINTQNYLQAPINVWSLPILIRYALQYVDNYHDAYALLKNAYLIAPSYIILAGIKPDQGVIFAREKRAVRIKDTLNNWLTYYPSIGTPVSQENSKSPVIIDPKHAQTKYIIVSNIDNDYAGLQDNLFVRQSLGSAVSSLPEKKLTSLGPRYRRNVALNSCCILPVDFSPEDLFHAVLWKNPVRNFITIYSTVMSPATNLCKTCIIW